MDAFYENESALNLSKRLRLSYASVQRYYEHFRHLCAHICESEYTHVRERNCEYEEYFYLEHSKQRDKQAVFDAQNFLSFDYQGHIYNIVMPSLQKYKPQFVEDNLEDVYDKSFSKFKRKSRIIKLSSHHNKIVRFWEYFETVILHYKGIPKDLFPLYLKEMEFKFNHTKEESLNILESAYFREEII